jgi:hypothetical protein
MSELGEKEHRAVVNARRGLVRAIEREFPPKTANALVAVAVAGFFADICAASSGRADLVAIINAELARVGLQLTELPRH